MRVRNLAVAGLLVGFVGSANAGVNVNFNLLTWNDAQAADSQGTLASAVGLKPSSGQNEINDWLVFAGDDQALQSTFNPAGALSHNMAEISGDTSTSKFNNAPSLTGSLTLGFTQAVGSAWSVAPIAQAYTGVATPAMQMNQYLVAPNDPATLDAKYNVDGVVSPGSWHADALGNWALNYASDFYFATNADGDPSPADIDLTFSDTTQNGYLIPVGQLNTAALAGVTLASPAGFYTGDFKQYLLDEIAPRLPDDATYLLVTQMDKTKPVYAESGLPVSTNSAIGNTTIAYTTSAIPEPASLGLLGVAAAWLMTRRRAAARA